MGLKGGGNILQNYRARTGDLLYYHYFRADSQNVMILLHGITEANQYLHPLAEFVAKENLAHVYTPDLRGYGPHAQKRGDLDYIGQLDDDLMDLIKHIKELHPQPNIIVAGHSAGGGTTLRMAASKYRHEVDRYLLLAPFVHPLAPTVARNNPNSSGNVNVGRLILLHILNRLRIRLFNHSIVYRSKKAIENPQANETQELSYRLFNSRFPEDYVAALQAIDKPTLVLVGDEDEEFDSTQYEPLFSKYTNAQTKLIPGADHNSILSAPATFASVKEWLTEEDAPSKAATMN